MRYVSIKPAKGQSRHIKCKMLSIKQKRPIYYFNVTASYKMKQTYCQLFVVDPYFFPFSDISITSLNP